MGREKDASVEEKGREFTFDTAFGSAVDLARDDFALEGAEDYESELDCVYHEPRNTDFWIKISPLTLAIPVPWLISPSEASSMS